MTPLSRRTVLAAAGRLAPAIGPMPLPLFGTDEQTTPALLSAALGVSSVAGWRAYNKPTTGTDGVPPSWPGSAAGTKPSGTTMSLVSIKPSLPLSTSQKSALATYFGGMGSGDCVTLWHEGERAGYSPAVLKQAHSDAYTIFKAHAGAGAKYFQAFTTYTAYSGSSHYPLSQWVATQSNGSPLDFYGLDAYPINNNTDAAHSTDPALTQLKSIIARPKIGITETNYTTGTGITWTGTQAQWFSDIWDWAVANNCNCFLPYFDTANGVPWPPNSGTIAELTTLNNLSIA